MPPGRWFESLPCWLSWTTPKLRTRKILQTSRAWSSNSRRSWWGNILSIVLQISYNCFELWGQVDRVDFDGEGNLLQLAVKTNQKEYLQILLDYGSAVLKWEYHPKSSSAWTQWPARLSMAAAVCAKSMSRDFPRWKRPSWEVTWRCGLVDCPTRWSLWYRYLDFYVDHLVGGCDPI